MLKERVDRIEEIVHELDGRCLMHEIFIAQLLARTGMIVGDMDTFVKGVLTLVGNDLKTNAQQTTDKDAALRFTHALDAFAQFATTMQNALGEAPKGKVN
ncbi:hypothetical protein G6L46_10095 [Agrobacterium rhizogenes]|uniref:hypothetical protein n=1 Tax=Rhizobium rhizogenes TaxID=359 RepID=UPI001573064D|nr:hypothetical protein [Rhizobium rhizogenes]NTF87475.1 hypothetical protein [Rhizobium rhizogenes]